MTSCQWPNPRRLTQVLRCHYPPPLFLRGATMRSFFWIGLSLCIFTVCTKSALTHRPNLSSARDLAAALRSELVGGPFQGICSSTTAFGSNAMANCDSTVLPHNETAGMKQDSYSGTFMKWAEPLLRLVADAPRSSKTSALEIAATTWNAVTLEDAGVAPGAIAEMKERLAQLPPPGADLFGAIVTELIESRRTQFSDAKWTISKCELRGTGEKTRVFLQANPIPTP